MEFRNIDDEARRKLDEFLPNIDGITGANRALLEDMLKDYFTTCAMVDEVRASVLRDGTTVEGAHGGVAKNPDVTVMHSLCAEKASLLPKIMKIIKECAPGAGDELTAYLESTR